MKRWASVLLGLICCGAAFAATDAQPPSGAPPLLFQQLDSNRDGYVVRDEARDAVNRQEIDFDKLDADGDGRLSEEEMSRPATGERAIK